MKTPITLLALVAALATTARADVPQAGPMTVPGTCVVNSPTTAKTIAELCGITSTPAVPGAALPGQANFVVWVPSKTQAVCLGSSSVGTGTAARDAGVQAADQCWPICDPSTGTECIAAAFPVRGDTHKWYLRSTVATKVYIIFGSTP